MTAEEEITYLKGRVDALAKLCSFLVATHNIGDDFARMYKIRALKELNRSGLSGNDQVYAEGYASLVDEIETARETVRTANLHDS